MKPINLIIAAVVALGAWKLYRLYNINAPEKSLREDKPAPAVPKSSDILAGRPKLETMFALPTVIAGLAPAPEWSFDDVASTYHDINRRFMGYNPSQERSFGI